MSSDFPVVGVLSKPFLTPLLCGTHLLQVKMDTQANRISLLISWPSELPAECHTRQNVRNNIKLKRKHNNIVTIVMYKKEIIKYADMEAHIKTNCWSLS